MGNSSDSSNNDKTSCAMLKRLDRHNWSTWKKRFENVITAKGYEEIMNNDWIKVNNKTPEYRKMLAWCMNKLFSAVKEELHPVLLANNSNIYAAMDALANACGEKSILTLCNKLFTMINCTYFPGLSLSQHLNI
ncbi:hypothetical protein PTTG_10193 [Puccinia triticina 1-1 BBBD Race 1]|uniref:DUF4219 domain-containing protein n=1 Tax=Puccinia triticina (isolate 1-1 / race 1 (BBBD)) TaxID=630390 RepID=A0A0C4FAF2_PUCT1|nr:hypothetical protein PTTG_10193 [Puccinia triticina 1-1 BBBD Race 1]